MKINKIAILVGLMILGFASQSSAMEMSRNNAYEVLGLDPESASPTDIKTKYYMKAASNHPDYKTKDDKNPDIFNDVSRALQILLPSIASEIKANNNFLYKLFREKKKEEYYKNFFYKFEKEYNIKLSIHFEYSFPSRQFDECKELCSYYHNLIEQKEINEVKPSKRKNILPVALTFFGMGALAGAAYLWIYHPEKVVAFKNDVIVPGFTKISNFAKSFYVKK